MENQSSSDHLNSSLTDLMTSLMVIFILLLLVFVSHSASKNAAIADVLLQALRKDLAPQGFSNNLIRPDPRDPDAILVIVPDKLMDFAVQSATLKPQGAEFLKSYIPTFAGVLCSPQFRSNVQSIIVEGHTDSQAWMGMTPQQSENANLRLSQQRSMSVVEDALKTLSDNPAERACFIKKLSATGRGPQGLEPTAAESRRVIFRIRIKASDKQQVESKVM